MGLFKRTFYKVIGGGMLTWSEVSEVVLDVKTHLNCRPYRMWKMTSNHGNYKSSVLNRAIVGNLLSPKV